MKPEKKTWYYDNGKIEEERHYLDGELHREDGPAIISYYQDGSIWRKVWYLNDKHHREDGPAYIKHFEDGTIDFEAWFLNGEQLTPEEVEDLKIKLEIEEITHSWLVGETCTTR